MKISKRKLQEIIKDSRANYKINSKGKVIIKSNKGYKKSNDKFEIELFAYEMIRTGLAMMKEGMDFLSVNKGGK